MSVLRLVDDKDTELSYLDSGAIQNDNYVTLFLLHGHTFYSPIFNKLLPLALKHNIRIVAVTRRDYRGSTPFSPAELDVIWHGDAAAKTDFLKDRAFEIATFLDRFTQENKLPKASSDGTRGGIAVLGWSLGNIQSLSVIGLAQHLPRDLTDRLEPYLKHLILYECPYHSLGFLDPPNAYHPLRDPTIPGAEKNDRFSKWVSGYFKHPGLAVRDIGALEYTTPSQHRHGTTTTMSREELDSVTDLAPGPRSEDGFFVGSDPQMMSRVRDDIFFPDANTVIWPKLKVASVLGTETTWSVIYASWQLENYMKDEKRRKDGGNYWKRSLDIVPVEGINHFAHWDDPEKLMQVFANILSS